MILQYIMISKKGQGHFTCACGHPQQCIIIVVGIHLETCIRAVQDQTESDLVPFPFLALSPTAHCNLLQQLLQKAR